MRPTCKIAEPSLDRFIVAHCITRDKNLHKEIINHPQILQQLSLMKVATGDIARFGLFFTFFFIYQLKFPDKRQDSVAGSIIFLFLGFLLV